MLRTWEVRLSAMKLTLSVRSFQTPDTPLTWARPPSWPSVPTSRATRVTSSAKAESWSTMVLIVDFSSQDLALRVDGDLLAQVAVGDGRGDLGDVADLGRQVRRHEVDVVGEVLPDPGHAPDLGAAAQLALGADLAGDPGDLVGEGRELVDHRVHGELQLEQLAGRLDRHRAGQVAARHRRRHQRRCPAPGRSAGTPSC